MAVKEHQTAMKPMKVVSRKSTRLMPSMPMLNSRPDGGDPVQLRDPLHGGAWQRSYWNQSGRLSRKSMHGDGQRPQLEDAALALGDEEQREGPQEREGGDPQGQVLVPGGHGSSKHSGRKKFTAKTPRIE